MEQTVESFVGVAMASRGDVWGWCNDVAAAYTAAFLGGYRKANYDGIYWHLVRGVYEAFDALCVGDEVSRDSMVDAIPGIVRNARIAASSDSVVRARVIGRGLQGLDGWRVSGVSPGVGVALSEDGRVDVGVCSLDVVVSEASGACGQEAGLERVNQGGEFRDDFCGRVEGSGDDFGTSFGVERESSSKGKNYSKNKRRRDNCKALRKQREQMCSVPSPRDCGTSPHHPESGGAFVHCDLEVKKKLQESRASMLIAENEARAAKARSTVRHLNMVKESRVNESKFELDRLTVEQKLRKISEARLGSGFVEGTVCSSAATPELSSGSVSPNSSISMAEVKRMENLIVTLEAKVAGFEKLSSASSSFVSNSVRLFLTKEEEDLILDERRVKKEREKYEKFCEVEDSYDY